MLVRVAVCCLVFLLTASFIASHAASTVSPIDAGFCKVRKTKDGFAALRDWPGGKLIGQLKPGDLVHIDRSAGNWHFISAAWPASETKNTSTPSQPQENPLSKKPLSQLIRAWLASKNNNPSTNYEELEGWINGKLLHECYPPSRTAERRIIGFSKDGSKFALRVHGGPAEQEMSFVSLYVVDTRTNQQMPGTPVQYTETTDPEERRTTQAHRRVAQAQERTVLKRMGPFGRQGESLPFAAPKKLDEPYKFPLCDTKKRCEDYELYLDDVPFPAKETEKGQSDEDMAMAAKPTGFRLTLKTPFKTYLLHEDKDLPEIRKEASSYGISDIIRIKIGNTTVLVILLWMSIPGLEGSDLSYTEPVITRLTD